MADPNQMRTVFGRRRGWEVDFKIRGCPRLMWRDGGIRPATATEIALWRRLKRDCPGEFGVWTRG